MILLWLLTPLLPPTNPKWRERMIPLSTPLSNKVLRGTQVFSVVSMYFSVFILRHYITTYLYNVITYLSLYSILNLQGKNLPCSLYTEIDVISNVWDHGSKHTLWLVLITVYTQVFGGKVLVKLVNAQNRLKLSKVFFLHIF